MNAAESDVKSKLNLAQNLNFSPKKLEKVELFINEVLSYNKKYNLISKNSESEIWNRHALDSAQLIKIIDPNKFNSLSDLGTGAGFPGIILSIFFSDIPKFHVKLYEKSKVKIKFIRSIKSKLNLKNISIYDNDYQTHLIDSDYIVCRAFKKLPEVLKVSREIARKPHQLIVMLGKSAQDELNKASKGMIYKYKLLPSITRSDSKILLVEAKK
tara:strand:- start:314 stop:952 length:639 start_codon:yes stop_codon:yes gene_type:complete